MNPKAGHSYAREFPGHESLNFDFNKKNLDTDTNIYGYVQWVGSPRKFAESGVVFFYSKNLKSSKGEIVGIYGNVKLLDPLRKTSWKGFENDQLISNIMADKSMSSLFPIPLNSKRYSKKRLVPQAGFTYIDLKLATQIISDEISELKESGSTREEFQKFSKIFEFITGNKYDDNNIFERASDELEQQEIQQIISKRINKDEIIQELKSLNPKLPIQIEFTGKTFKRDNKTTTQLKFLRDFKCQMCETKIPKKDGSFYIEAAHITRKSYKGPETPDNILILCPNHHKEFDFGNRIDIDKSKNQFVFELNGKRYEINMNLE